MSVASLIIACVALVVSALAAWYTRRSALAHERARRGETDPARRTRFDLEVPRPAASYMPRVDDTIARVLPSAWTLTATNAGLADAHDVSLSATVDREEVGPAAETLVAPGGVLECELGNVGPRRLVIALVEWTDEDGKRRSQDRKLRTP